MTHRQMISTQHSQTLTTDGVNLNIINNNNNNNKLINKGNCNISIVKY